MTGAEGTEINDREWIHAADDAALLIELVRALVPPEPERLPLGSAWIDSPMSQSDARTAVGLLKNQALHIAVCWLCLALRPMSGAKAYSDDPRIGPCLEIAELLRAAYDRDPLRPVWQLGPESLDLVLEAPGIVTLTTRGLAGQPVDDGHFGGMEAILRLLRFARDLWQEAPDG